MFTRLRSRNVFRSIGLLFSRACSAHVLFSRIPILCLLPLFSTLLFPVWVCVSMTELSGCPGIALQQNSIQSVCWFIKITIFMGNRFWPIQQAAWKTSRAKSLLPFSQANGQAKPWHCLLAVVTLHQARPWPALWLRHTPLHIHSFTVTWYGVLLCATTLLANVCDRCHRCCWCCCCCRWCFGRCCSHSHQPGEPTSCSIVMFLTRSVWPRRHC